MDRFFRCLLPALAGIVMLGSCTQGSFEESLQQALTRDDANTAPTVITVDTVDIDVVAKTVKAYGRVLSEGSSAVTKRGFLLSSTTDQPLLGMKASEGVRSIAVGKGVGDFSKVITAVTSGKTYHLRAYAINETDTAYANVFSFEQRGPRPEVETYPVDLRVHKAAIVYGHFKKAGDIVSFGVCLSHNPNPTVDDICETAADTCKIKGMTGEFGVLFDNLDSERLYHTRAFAISSTDTVYGEERIFKTARKGTVNWGFWANEEEDARVNGNGADKRIRTAMDSACYYYNNYTTLNKWINVNYEPGVQTADCNIDGWMRYGPGTTYQWVGTAQHEISHALGVGTSSNWNSLFDSSGLWKGKNANRVIRACFNDQSYYIHLSGVHFYPGGINYSSEVSSGEKNTHGFVINGKRMLISNAFILHGMRMDGMTTY
ncbi:MAG: hypothetical protein J6Y84_07690 [Bacteroidaceae bacterium]|nr:hypothetical protein [Bacteroidaceae bacterium]